MKKTKLKITSLILAGILSIGLISYNGYFNNNITDEDTSWTVIDYNNLTMDDLSIEDINLMHEDNWLNQYVARQCSKSVSNLTLSDFLYIKKIVKNNSEITNIPNSIKFLSNLTYLDLAHNKLTTLPESIGNLTNLINLELWNNQLTSLPNSIGNLTKLNYLHLTDNQLTSLPNSIGNLTNLINLNLDSNQLISLPDSIYNLTDLNLVNNLLEYISSDGPSETNINFNLFKDSDTVSQLYYTENVPTELTCSSLKELNTIINNIDYLKNNIKIYFDSISSIKKLNNNISLKVVPTDNSFFDNNGNAIKTGDTYVYVKLNHISDSNPYGYIRKTYNETDSKMISSDDYLKIPVHIVQRNTSVSLKVDEELPIESILKESLKTLDITNITEAVKNTTIQSLDENIISNEGKALSIGITQVVLVTPNYGLITANIYVTDNSTSGKYLNVKFTQPNILQ